jgi:hypothetical protein
MHERSVTVEVDDAFSRQVISVEGKVLKKGQLYLIAKLIVDGKVYAQLPFNRDASPEEIFEKLDVEKGGIDDQKYVRTGEGAGKVFGGGIHAFRNHSSCNLQELPLAV